jgi:GntR family transcriptional regulator, transcriptional repressor for pyruvate dehydrogenase complex
MAGRRSGASFVERPRPRAHEYVVEQLRRQIMLGLVKPGETFPPERELARILSVGRSTVQEALAQLTRDGLVVRRPGRNGGTIVTGSAADVAESEETRTTLYPLVDVVYEALDFRLEIEPIVAGLAARNTTPLDLHVIQNEAIAVIEAMDDRAFMEHDTAFHQAVAEASRNRFYAGALRQVRAVLDEVLAALPGSPSWHARSYGQHAEVIAALVAHDEHGAREAMRRHVEPTDSSARALLSTMKRNPLST